jgi:hypothetical protein
LQGVLLLRTKNHFHVLILVIQSLLDTLNLHPEFGMISKHFPQPCEYADDLDIHMNGDLAVKNARKHGYTLFRKYERSCRAEPSPSRAAYHKL